MCGISGFLGGDSYNSPKILENMGAALISRGPDQSGVWCNQESRIGFSHRRLSILDTTASGRQPMISKDSRYVLIFNGEIYNHLKLRDEIDSNNKNVWLTGTDTETLLAGFMIWGIKSTIERCIGMFAFAVWDRYLKKLTLGRDRIGEKPLYYGWQGSGGEAAFIFGSELNALKQHPSFEGEISRASLCLFMRYGYVPGPHSIFCGIYKMMPGTLLQVSLESRNPKIESYWSMINVAASGNSDSFSGNPQDAVSQLDELLKSSVSQQMVADVPVGAFLSGGIDSTTIAAIMQSHSAQPIKTFTIGFNEKSHNEAEYAQAVARHLGSDHTELYVTSKEALSLIPKLPQIFCEPFADSSQIPTFLVSQLAKKKVTVSLSGDGGDELFAGYNRYVFVDNLWGRLDRLPEIVRSTIAQAIYGLSPSMWNKIFSPINPILPSSLRMANIGDKLYKGADVLTSNSIDSLYAGIVSHWRPEELVLGASEPLTYVDQVFPVLRGFDNVQKMMLIDSISYLPDDILVKLDRAAMAVSLEGRVPFLDHRVVEFAWRMPQSLKLKDGVGKWILRQVLYKYVPKELVERPKMGFGIPIDSWLRGPLREWAEELLNERRLCQEGFFDPRLIRIKWTEHLSGVRNWQYQLWNVLMFQAWLENETAS